MINFISGFIPKPFARITVNGAHCIVRVGEVPRILYHESEETKLELVWMSERRVNRLPELTGF